MASNAVILCVVVGLATVQLCWPNFVTTAVTHRGRGGHMPLISFYIPSLSTAKSRRRLPKLNVQLSQRDLPELNSLESDPYYDTSSIPLNTFHPKAPYIGEIVRIQKLIGEGERGGVYYVVVDHGGHMPCREGQSFGVLPKGINPRNGKPYTPRLYSVASSRYGDDKRGTSASFCVRWSLYYDKESGIEEASKAGVCSSQLCMAKVGDKVSLSGPTGKILLLPEHTPEADIIMVATGTGVAPYRGFMQRLFMEKTPAAKAFTGLAWLFLGVPDKRSALFHREWETIHRLYPEQFRFDYALSREMKNLKGEKMYIQDRVKEHGEELFERLERGAHIYFCGLRDMMRGILQVFTEIAQSRGEQWDDVLRRWKANKQWHVEVY